METQTLQLAMWLGPRTVSTAFMRSWENRPDTIVFDEPFYAHYLNETGLDHPMADEIIAVGNCDWHAVLKQLLTEVPGKPVSYQKHMAHHLLPEMSREWFDKMTHAFLIRDPAEMLMSMDVKMDHFGLSDTGLPQQVEIFDFVVNTTGKIPAVISSKELLMDPAKVLQGLCDYLNIPFYDQMLSWPKGPRDSDGVWARHWYGSGEQSTGFQGYKPKSHALPMHLKELHQECLPYYQRLYEHRLRSH